LENPCSGVRKGLASRAEFRLRYRNELDAAGKMEELEKLAERSKKETLILLYATRDVSCNHATALKVMIENFVERSVA
jgi:uncharacterized protein YeaO (DUF488 family)